MKAGTHHSSKQQQQDKAVKQQGQLVQAGVGR